MNGPNRIFFCVAALLFSSSVLAADTADVTVLSTVTESMKLAATNIGPMALGWLGAFMCLQFVITNIKLLGQGAEISDVFTKLLAFMFAAGISIILLKSGPDFIQTVGNGIFEKFLHKNVPSAGDIITATLGLCTTLIAAIFAIGIVHTAIANLLVSVVLIVFGTGMFLAVKVFMLYLELGMVVLLSPLSFSFLGLSALRDQGIAPLKSLISLIYRAIVLGIAYQALGQVTTVAGTSLAAINWINPVAWPAAMNTIFSMLCAFPVLGYLAYKSDSIAASLAGGSTNMGPGDVAGAAAAGAAAGAAMASGGASVAASSPVQSMGDFMKSLGGSGSVSNASSMGAGSTPVGPAPSSPPSMSKAGGGASPAVNGGASNGLGLGSTKPNNTTRPSSGNTETAKFASDGVAAAGGSQAVSEAAATAAMAGGSNEDVAAAVVGAGGTEAQGAAAATAMAVGEAGGSASAIKAGAEAAGAGKSSEEIANAVTHAVKPGSTFGESQEVGAAAARASTTKPAQARSSGGKSPVTTNSGANGESASVGGGGLEKQVGDLVNVLSQSKNPSFGDKMKDLNQHVAQEKAATHVSINTHHSD